MKISVSTLPFFPQPLETIFNYLSDLNVNYIEIINEYPHHILGSDLFESYDMQISVHAPLSDINVASHNETIRNASINQIKNSMDIACELGSQVVVVHPGHMPILGRRFTDKIMGYNKNSLEECSQYAQDVGVLMCVENMPDIHGLLYKNLKELELLILDIDAYITLDVGHAHNNGFCIDDMLEIPRIKHVHLSDNDGSYDSHQALGLDHEIEGNRVFGSDLEKVGKGIDFKSLFTGLKKIKYQDILVVEMENPSDVDKSLLYLEKILM